MEMKYRRLTYEELCQLAYSGNIESEISDNCIEILKYLRDTTKNIEVLKEKVTRTVFLYEDGYVHYSEIAPARRFYFTGDPNDENILRLD